MRNLGVVALVVMFSACSTGSAEQAARKQPSPAATTAESPSSIVDALPRASERVWSTKLDALQQPVPADDVLITVAAARGDELDVVALDRQDGEVLWRRPLMVVDSSIGAYVGSLVHESADGTSYVVMQQAPTGPRLRAGAPLPYVALDPGTGEVVARTRPVVQQFGAPSCEDGLDACLRISSEDRFEETRWVLGTWELRPEKDRFPTGASSLVAGSDVYTVYGPVRNYAVAKAIGRVGSAPWRVPHRRVTGGDRWLLDDSTGMVFEDSGVVVVQLLQTTSDSVVARYEQGGQVRLDLAERRTAGLDLATGEVLWRHGGADIRCLELTRTEIPVRCVFTGARIYRKDRDPRLQSAHGHLEGFAPLTGETTWRQELGTTAVRAIAIDFNMMDVEVDRVADADDLVVVPTPEGPRLLSLTDGSTRDVARGESLLCSSSVPYRHRFDVGGSDVAGFGDTRSRYVMEPCTAQGKRAPMAPSAAGLLTGGVDAGEDLRVVARRSVVEAYQLS